MVCGDFKIGFSVLGQISVFIRYINYTAEKIVEKQNTSYELPVAGSDMGVTSSNLQVTISNSRVTSSNPRVTSSILRVTSSNSRVRRLKARVVRLKTRDFNFFHFMLISLFSDW